MTAGAVGSKGSEAFYYDGLGESELTLELMRRIDEQFLETPFYGSRQMARWLRRESFAVSRKRMRRLMRKMGLQALPHPEHRVYPYLLRDRAGERANSDLGGAPTSSLRSSSAQSEAA